MLRDDAHSDRTDVVIDATTPTDEEFGTAVVTAIADELGSDPATLPPLRDSIDPDVLNGFRDGGGSARALSFEYIGYEVVVTSDGVIRLYPLA